MLILPETMESHVKATKKLIWVLLVPLQPQRLLLQIHIVPDSGGLIMFHIGRGRGLSGRWGGSERWRRSH